MSFIQRQKANSDSFDDELNIYLKLKSIENPVLRKEN